MATGSQARPLLDSVTPSLFAGVISSCTRAVLVHIHFGLDQWSVIAHRCRCHRLWEFCDIEKLSIETLWHCDIVTLKSWALWHCDIVTLRSWARLWTTLGLGGGFWRTISRASNPNQQSSHSDQIFTNKDSPSVKYIYVSRGTRLGSSTNIETFEMSSFNDKYIAHIICLTVRGAVHFRVFCHHNFSLTSPL